MNEMKKVKVYRNEQLFILYNDTFYVKSCDNHIVWTSNPQDAMVFNTSLEADSCLEKINKFLHSGV